MTNKNKFCTSNRNIKIDGTTLNKANMKSWQKLIGYVPQDVYLSDDTLSSNIAFGINKNDIGPLAKCSFEETTDQFYKAATYGEKDTLNGVSSNIMMGQIIPCGTGESDILLDEMKLLNVKPKKKKIIKKSKQNTYCGDNMGLDFNLDKVEAEVF